MQLVRKVSRPALALVALLAALAAPNANVGAEDLPVYDEPVVSALSLLAVASPTQHLRAVLDTNRVTVQFIGMAPGVYARYSVARHTIEIDSRWRDAAPITLAAVIAHEATHAQDAVSGYLSSGGESACIDSEIRAFRTSALFWIDTYGKAGKANPQDDLERQLNLIADRQQRDPMGLEDVVRQTYSAQCAH